MAPLVSVVMSLYNPEERYLRKQLASIDVQDWDNLEIVVYNDNPQDVDRRAFCESICVRHRVRYFHGTKNLGYTQAFGKLMELAQGTYVALSDQDDVWLPGRISQCIEVMESGGFLLSTCDRQIIDGDDKILSPSWRKDHPKSLQDTWRSRDHLLPNAAFACYSIGMATIVLREAALRCLPFPSCTGHDKWLALCCAEMGPCAYVEQPLVQYRRHERNVSGRFAGITCKADWYKIRVESSCRIVEAFADRFPESADLKRMLTFVDARTNRKILAIWRNRDIAPEVAYFEIALAVTPDAVFKAMLRAYSRNG